MRIEYRLTGDEAAEEAARVLRLVLRQPLVWPAVAAVVLALSAAMFLTADSLWVAALILGIVFGAITVSVVNPPWLRAWARWTSRISFPALVGRTDARNQRWVELTPIGVKFRQARRDRFVPWSQVRRVVVTPDFIDLALGTVPMLRIPAHGFADNEAREHALELIESFLPDDARIEYS